jgi:peptidoglycan/xylan/chitin deacetylase (PgdA/CDA1 family)
MRPKFIVTVDTETFRVSGKSLPFATHHYAELSEGTFGVQRIMDVCDQYGAKATFFVDVYMHHEYGETNVAELCQRIHRAGHDVQLHAHPSWLPGSPSEFMCDFSLDRQVDILAEGKEFIERCTGRSPSGFRAGAYGANLDTIRALKRLGFRVDSSYFLRNRNCELSRQLNHGCFNRPFRIEGILEIPVTTYWLWRMPSPGKNSKIDVNACSWTELRSIVPKLAHSVEYIVLFLHSFSFVRWDGNGGNLTPKRAPLERFEALLRMVRENLNADFTTIDQISKMSPEGFESAGDFVPTLPLLYIVPRIFNRFFD